MGSLHRDQSRGIKTMALNTQVWRDLFVALLMGSLVIKVGGGGGGVGGGGGGLGVGLRGLVLGVVGGGGERGLVGVLGGLVLGG